MNCEDIEISLTGYLDRELTQQEVQRVEVHLSACSRCQAVLGELRRAKEMAGSLQIQQPSAEEWQIMESRILESTTRKLGWIILVVWLGATCAYGLYQLAVSPSEPVAAKILVFGLVAGFGLIFFSVLMERLRELRTDRYRGVQK